MNVSLLRKEFDEHMREAKELAKEAEAQRLLTASNTLQIAELTKVIDRLVKLQDDFFSRQKEAE